MKRDQKVLLHILCRSQWTFRTTSINRTITVTKRFCQKILVDPSMHGNDKRNDKLKDSLDHTQACSKMQMNVTYRLLDKTIFLMSGDRNIVLEWREYFLLLNSIDLSLNSIFFWLSCFWTLPNISNFAQPPKPPRSILCTCGPSWKSPSHPWVISSN